MSVRTFLNCEWDTVQGAVSCLEKISPGCHHRGDTPGAIGKECLVKNPTPVSFVGWHDNLSVTEETDVVFGSSTVAFPANLSGVLRWPTEILIAKSWHDSPACEIRTRSFTCLLKCWGHDAWLSARCPTMASWAMRMLALIIETCSSFFFFFFFAFSRKGSYSKNIYWLHLWLCLRCGWGLSRFFSFVWAKEGITSYRVPVNDPCVPGSCQQAVPTPCLLNFLNAIFFIQVVWQKENFHLQVQKEYLCTADQQTVFTLWTPKEDR